MNCPLNYDGSTVVITGGSSGIGLATAQLLSTFGARVCLVARDMERLEQARDTLTADGHSIYSVDLADLQTLPDEMSAVFERTGSVNAIVHAAGVHSAMPLQFTTLEDSIRMMGINFHAAAELSRLACQKGVLTKPANMVYVSSVVAHLGQAAVSLYAATKGALNAFAKSLAVELASRDIRVNCVAAGIVKTPLTERFFSRLTQEQRSAIEDRHLLGTGSSEDVALAIAYLLASNWVTGSTLTVDGGYSAH